MEKFIKVLIKTRKFLIIGKFSVVVLKLLGLEIPKKVIIGKNVKFNHLSTGLVIHPKTVIEDDVQIFQGVTIGRADAYQDYKFSEMEGIVIKRGAVLCAGSKILCKKGILTVGENTIVGANSVLLNSTGDNEIWAGIPAKLQKSYQKKQ
ncbi:serine O-acetyltransferase [Bacillus tianshenii]|uniref:Serine O-acetyltransferase n=1 Tax=Sutcliffiella tianshenii TaxID=1463404 RepID=A0ABS2NV77_9BACI|nr:hypothetical protein [Bacillus tianshenii]MBM7618571.1 serine O-acetyltransferase [Bacillus tianshenii]